MRDNNVSEVTILCVQLYSNDLPVTLYCNVTHISTKITPYESKTWAISSAKQNCSLGLIFMSEERARTSTVAFLLACAVIDFRSTF